MWICLNDSFLSIVDPGAQGPKGDYLLVRARIKGDIERVFPKANVIVIHGRDYLFRAFIPRKQVADAIAKRVMENHATNFKNSVPENMRHDAYARIWGVMHGLQWKLNGRDMAEVEEEERLARLGRVTQPLLFQGIPEDGFGDELDPFGDELAGDFHYSHSRPRRTPRRR